MNIWQQREQQGKDTRKALKKCPVNLKYIGCGFRHPVVNGMGQCSGCRNPDDGQLESQCRGCQNNEYFIEEVTA